MKYPLLLQLNKGILWFVREKSRHLFSLFLYNFKFFILHVSNDISSFYHKTGSQRLAEFFKFYYLLKALRHLCFAGIHINDKAQFIQEYKLTYIRFRIIFNLPHGRLARKFYG